MNDLENEEFSDSVACDLVDIRTGMVNLFSLSPKVHKDNTWMVVVVFHK